MLSFFLLLDSYSSFYILIKPETGASWVALVVRSLPANVGDIRDAGTIPEGRPRGKIPRRRAWQPTPVFLPGESPWTEEPGGLQTMQ